MYANIILLLTICELIARTVLCFDYEDNTNRVGTVLFSKHDLMKKRWTANDIRLLIARRNFQEILPPRSTLYNQNENMLNLMYDYFGNAFDSIKKQKVDSDLKEIMNDAFLDTIGGYFKTIIIPIAKLSYYSGSLKHGDAFKIFKLYDDIKQNLKTNGTGWREPRGNVLQSIYVSMAPLQSIITRETSVYPCSKVSYLENSDSGLTMPLPSIIWKDNTGFMFIPLKNQSLIQLDSNATDALLKYYNTAKYCIEENKLGDPKEFGERFQDWLIKNILPHLNDDNLYPPFGSILALDDHNGTCHCDYTEYLKHNKTEPRGIKFFNFSVDVTSRKMLIIIVILLIEIAWCVPALIYLSYKRCKSASRCPGIPMFMEPPDRCPQRTFTLTPTSQTQRKLACKVTPKVSSNNSFRLPPKIPYISPKNSCKAASTHASDTVTTPSSGASCTSPPSFITPASDLLKETNKDAPSIKSPPSTSSTSPDPAKKRSRVFSIKYRHKNQKSKTSNKTEDYNKEAEKKIKKELKEKKRQEKKAKKEKSKTKPTTDTVNVQETTLYHSKTNVQQSIPSELQFSVRNAKYSVERERQPKSKSLRCSKLGERLYEHHVSGKFKYSERRRSTSKESNMSHTIYNLSRERLDSIGASQELRNANTVTLLNEGSCKDILVQSSVTSTVNKANQSIVKSSKSTMMNFSTESKLTETQTETKKTAFKVCASKHPFEITIDSPKKDVIRVDIQSQKEERPSRIPKRSFMNTEAQTQSAAENKNKPSTSPRKSFIPQPKKKPADDIVMSCRGCLGPKNKMNTTL